MTATKTSSAPLLELATRITEHALKLHNYIVENDLPQPTFAENGSLDFPIPADNKAMQEHRTALIEASNEMYELSVGPQELLGWRVMNNKYESAALRVLNNLRVADHVPLDSSISLTDLAAQLPISADSLARILRFTITSRVFTEPKKGYIAHSALSLALRVPTIRANLAHNLNDAFVSAAKLPEAIEAFPSGEEPNETAFNLAFGTELDYWKYIAQPGQEKQRADFHGSMQEWTNGQACSPNHLLRGNMDWKALPEGALVVDLGGSTGHVSNMIAEACPQLNFLIQDRPDVIAAGPSADVSPRLKFMPHSFMDVQTVVADVYLFRWIMHDWSDRYCVKILQNLIPSLKKGAKVVVMDAILPEPGAAPKVVEKFVRAIDLQMMVMLNAKERDKQAWIGLFKAADERFEVLSIGIPPDSALGIIEVVWTGEPVVSAPAI